METKTKTSYQLPTVVSPSLKPQVTVQARRSDWIVAGQFLKQRVPLDLIEHAIAQASLRRQLRPPEAEPLEPIRSLAYIRPLVAHLLRTGLDDGYRDYVAAKYAEIAR